MENINKLQYWKNTITKRPDKVQPALIVGTVLAAILGGLTSFNPFIGIATGLVMFLLVLVVPRPVLIVYGLTLLLPLTAGFARGSVLPFLRLGQALLVVGFILFLLSKPGRLLSSRLSAIDLAFMLFFLTGAVFPVLALYYRGESLNLTSTDNIYGVSSFQTLLGPLQYYLLYRIVVAVIASERQIKAVLELSFIACIIVSVIGILEKIIVPVKTLIETYYPPVLYSSANQNYVIPEFKVRVASTLAHYSGLGAYLTFTIIMALACYGNRARFNISPLLLLATVLLGSVTLILTGTFAAWIGLPVGAIVVFILIGRIPIGRMMIIPLIGFVIAAITFQPFLADRLAEQVGPGAAHGLVPSSLAFRIQLWVNIFLPAIGQHLWFGSGPNSAAYNSWSTEESQYLALLLRGGLLNFLSYILLIGTAIVICWRQIKQSRDAGQTVAIALLAILVTLEVMNVSAGYFTYAGGIQTIWTLLALVIASRQRVELGASTADEVFENSR